MSDASQGQSIGALSRRTGVKATTIRFYESIGLLPLPPRSGGNRRLYGPKHQARLAFIKNARALGFEMDSLKALLALNDRPELPCNQASQIARDRLADVDEKIAQLTSLRAELARISRSCDCGSVADCRVMDAISRR